MNTVQDDEKQTVRHMTVQDIEMILAQYFNVPRVECFVLRDNWSEPYERGGPVIVSTIRHFVI
jgi:hypothetical protein